MARVYIFLDKWGLFALLLGFIYVIGIYILHQDVPTLRPPPGPHASVGHREHGVPDSPRALRVPGGVVWAIQCPGHVPGANERRFAPLPSPVSACLL